MRETGRGGERRGEGRGAIWRKGEGRKQKPKSTYILKTPLKTGRKDTVQARRTQPEQCKS